METKSRWAWEEHCRSAALGGCFNSTGNLRKSATPDFWKEGVGKGGKSTLSSKPAAPGTVPFLGPWVRALFHSVTFNPTTYAPPLPVSHKLDSSASSSSLFGETANSADEAEAGRPIRTLYKATKPSAPVLRGGSSWSTKREPCIRQAVFKAGL